MYKIPCALEELVPYMRDPTFRLKYDELLRSIDFLKKYTDDFAVIKVVVKGQWPVSDREFITYIVTSQLDENVACPNPDVLLDQLRLLRHRRAEEQVERARRARDVCFDSAADRSERVRVRAGRVERPEDQRSAEQSHSGEVQTNSEHSSHVLRDV